MCSQKINRKKKRKKKSEQISTFPQRSFKDSNIEWLPSTHTHTKTDINLNMENAHPFRSNSPIPPFNRCDLLYLLVLLLDSFLLSCSLSFSLSRSLAPFQLVLYGRKTFIFSLLRGLFKIAYQRIEQKFFIRKYIDRAFLLRASLVLSHFTHSLTHFRFRLFASFHEIH